MLLHRSPAVLAGLSTAAIMPGRGPALDGPTHFVLSPAGPAVNGATAFKRRLFLAAGYAVLPVTHVQWEALPTQPERERYLRDRLTPLVARAGRTD